MVLKELEGISPGDILVQRYYNKEVARFLVLSRTIKKPNTSWLYCQYECMILSFCPERLGLARSPGDIWYIDNHDMKVDSEEWEIVGKSGLSWEDVEAKKT